jgi:Ca2+-binding EF-hand superfamily protein
MKSNDEGGEPYINVMNFCTIWRMITGNRGNLMEEMQIFNSFDADSNGYLEVSDFVTGFLNHSKDMNTNKLLIKLHSLVDGGSVMM